MVITYGSGPVDVNNINRQCPNPLRMAPVYNTEACTTLLYTVWSPNVLQKNCTFRSDVHPDKGFDPLQKKALHGCYN